MPSLAVGIIFIAIFVSFVDCMQPIGRDRLIRYYFQLGYSYRLILCFLIALHGVCISLRTLKRILMRLDLRRRGRYTSLSRVSRCLLVRCSIIRVYVLYFLLCRLNYVAQDHFWVTEQCIRGSVTVITL